METFSQTSRFDDFDAFAAAARSWDLEFQQIDGGSFSSVLTQCGCEDAQLGYAHFSRSLLQRGCSPAGLRTIVIPTEGCTPLRWRCQQIEPYCMLIFPRNGELESVSNPGFEICTLSFSERFLDRICHDLALPDFHTLVNHAEVFQCRAEDVRLLLKRFRQSIRVVSGLAQGRHPDFTDALHRELAMRVVSVLAKPVEQKTVQPVRLRDRAVCRAIDYIHANGRVPIALSELCRVSHASERTLEYGFRERFGMTPKNYLLKYRLNGMRRLLRRADPKHTRIVDLANRWGFWHMGQFAADYRRLFGELPSEMLGRCDRSR